ncbi:UNVERIFIED_CONTAM: hypothetical protein Sradi_2038300 [Sesamum radiatum]|uniref:Reverse transcriptase zinc-binding domain-containing protein n=1 Tax=Sesamum radiatum TaxID=300843 RepID=A0AAW2TGA3_SESRA
MDTECILGISLQRHGEEDTLVWYLEKHKFLVMSAYHVAARRRGEAECSYVARSWGFIWSSKAPPKVMLFAWRCVMGALPTSAQLSRRGVQVADGCRGYDPDQENTMHVLIFCSFAHLVWALSWLPWRLIAYTDYSTEEWFREVHSKLGRWEWDLFLTTFWALWWARNQKLFEGRSVEAQAISRMVV